MTTPETPPPDDLSERSAAFWVAVVADSEPSPADLELLAEGCRALDRADAARVHIAEQGVIVDDRYGTPKAHPAVDIERTSRQFFAAVCKQLGLNSADEPATGPRPLPGPKSRKMGS